MIYRSRFKSPAAAEDLRLLRENKGAVVIFGTGNYGALALHALRKRGIRVDRFCDNNKANQGKLYNGVAVISPDELKSSWPQALVLIAHLQFRHMAGQLKDSPGLKMLHCDSLFEELDLTDAPAQAPVERLVWMLDLYMFAIAAEREPGSLRLKSLDVVVTERCSLRCKDCSNLMQYYQSPKDAELGLLLASLDRFMKSVDALHEARIIGGEPFLYGKLPEVIERLASCPNCGQVTVFTNGTIIPDAAVLSVLRERKAGVIISDYGRLSKQSTKLKDLLVKAGIPVISQAVDSWQDCAAIAHRRRTDDELAQLFGNCCVNDALTLLHGKLYACPFSAHAANLKAVPPAADDVVDLAAYDGAALREKIRALCSERRSLGSCSYCAGRDYGVGRVDAAVQAKSPLPFERR